MFQIVIIVFDDDSMALHFCKAGLKRIRDSRPILKPVHFGDFRNYLNGSFAVESEKLYVHQSSNCKQVLKKFGIGMEKSAPILISSGLH